MKLGLKLPFQRKTHLTTTTPCPKLAIMGQKACDSPLFVGQVFLKEMIFLFGGME
jgi:hypothetical protein